MRSLSPHRRFVTVFAVLVLSVALIAPLMPQQVAYAAETETVTILEDTVDSTDGETSLREAIANVDDGGTITFQEGLTGTITLTGGELTITRNLTIIGPGADVLTVSGDDSVRVFNIGESTITDIEVEISGLTITAGRASTGGGIRNRANLTVTSSTISGNTAHEVGSGGDGGGIYNFQGKVTINGSTISDNTALDGDFGTDDGDGGGIFNIRGEVIITNSTVSGNSADNDAGGVRTSGILTITNSTFSDNTAGTQGGGILTSNSAGGDSQITITSSTIADNSASSGSGISVVGGYVDLENTIVANNLSGASNCAVQLPDFGSIDSSDYNLISDSSCFETGEEGANDLLDTDPELATLTNNGGSTETHAFDMTSDAYNTGGEDCPTATDQRGTPRPQQGACDIGAFELKETALQPTLTLPTEPVIVEATGPDGASIDFSDLVSAEDWLGNPIDVECEPALDSTFPVTETPIDVNCEATDSLDQTTEGSFTVQVQDTTAPVISPVDDLSVPATSPDGATVNYPTPTATDLVDESVAVTCVPPSSSRVEIGTSTVTCNAQDSAGNGAIPVSFDVIVLGARAQIVQLSQDIRGMDIPTGPKLVVSIFLSMAGRTADNHPVASCRFLETTTGLVTSFTPRFIDRADAADILADIQRIRTVMGCR